MWNKTLPGVPNLSLELYVKILPFLTKLGMKNGKQQLLKHLKKRSLYLSIQKTQCEVANSLHQKTSRTSH